MRFSIRDLLKWTAVAALVALLFRLFPPIGALLACIPLAALCFAMSRIAGWAAHVLEQHGNNRLIRPRSDYTGATDQKYVPPAER